MKKIIILTVFVPRKFEMYLVIVESANNLRNADGLFGTSDPYARMTMMAEGQSMTPAGHAEIAFSTQVVQNDLNPKWGECVLVVPPDAASSTLKIEIYDSDGKRGADGKPHPKDDLLGAAVINLANECSNISAGWNEVVSALSQSLTDSNRAKGSITLSVRPYAVPSVTVVSGSKLRNADGFFNKSDPCKCVSLTASIKGLLPTFSITSNNLLIALRWSADGVNWRFKSMGRD